MSAITVDGDLVHYEVLGRGRTVILLHGWLGSWRYWIPTMRLLQLRYRVYAIDLFGFGDSSKNPQKYGMDQQVALMEEFVSQLAIPKTAIVAHGYGAQVAVEFARRFPEKVARMMLVSAPLFDPGDLQTRVPAGIQRPLTQDNAPRYGGTGSIPLASKGGSSDPTISRRPTSIGPSDATIPNASNQTLSPNHIDRDRLREQALSLGRDAMRTQESLPPARRPSTDIPPKPDPNNPLYRVLRDGMDSLMAMCFRRASERGYDVIQPDVIRSDPEVLRYSAAAYDPGMMLDTLRLLEIPILIAHGAADPIMTRPTDDVLNYLTLEHDNTILPVLFPDVKHFPMLEAEEFMRLVGQFLETPDISKIERKERWRRRTH